MEEKTLTGRISYLVNAFDGDIDSCLVAAKELLDKTVESEVDKLRKLSSDAIDAFQADQRHSREVLRDLYAEVFSLRASGDSEDGALKKIEEHFDDREKTLASYCDADARFATRERYLRERGKWIYEKLVKESKWKADQYKKTEIAKLTDEAGVAVKEFFSPFEQPQIDDDGKIESPIVPCRRPNAVPFALSTIGGIEVPESLDVDHMSIITYSKDNAVPIKNIVTNLLYHCFMTFAPDLRIVVWRGALCISRDWDGGMLTERLIDQFVAEVRSQHDFDQEVSEHLKSRRRDRMLVAVMMLPEIADDYSAKSLRASLEKLGSECGLGAKFSLICIADKATAEKLALTDKTFGENSFEKNVIDADALMSVPSAIAEDRERKINVMQAVIEPPKKLSPGVLSIPFGRDEAKEVFSIPYTAADASAMFIFGRTGTGKSFTLDNFVYKTANKYSPSQVQFMLIDCKDCMDMIKFSSLPHARCILNADVDILTGLTSNIWKEFSERDKVMRSKKCRNIDEYNELRLKDGTLAAMPRIIVVIDEFAYISEAKKSAKAEQDRRKAKRFIEDLSSLVKKTRSVGIHYLCATQTDADFHADFDRGVFNYTVTLKNEFGRYSMDFRLGDDHSAQQLPLVPENVKVTESMVDGLVEKWNADACRLRPVVCADTDTLPKVENFPAFGNQLVNYLSATAADEIRLLAGVNLQEVLSLYAIPFSVGHEHPHLLVTGSLDYESNGEKFVTALRSFISGLVWSADQLYRKGAKIRVTVLDVHKIITVESQCITRSGDVAEAVAKWQKNGSDDPDAWNLLVLTGAEEYLKVLSYADRQSFESKKTDKTLAEGGVEPIPQMKDDNDLDGGLAIFEALAKGMTTQSSSPKSASKESSNRHPLDVIIEAANAPKGTNGKSLMIVHSSNPEKMRDYFTQDGHGFSRFRFAAFRCTNGSLVRGVEPPSSFKVGSISDDCSKEEGWESFMPFIELPKEI